MDALDAKNMVFPVEWVTEVRELIGDFLRGATPNGFVSSAACGADLLALDEAGKLDIERKVVIPFDRDLFYRTSVGDRPGEWGPLYNSVIDRAAVTGDLTVLGFSPNDAGVYELTNNAILDEAERWASVLHIDVAAAVAWNGARRNGTDMTAAFLGEARRRGFPVSEILIRYA